MDQPLNYYYQLLEQVLTESRIDPATARGTQAGSWNLRMGSASLFADIIQSQDAKGNPLPYGYFQVLAPVCAVPVNNQHLFTKELLEINHALYGVAFTIFKDHTYIKSIRELQGLEKSEIKSTLERVGIYSDEWDDKLRARYGIFTGGGTPS